MFAESKLSNTKIYQLWFMCEVCLWCPRAKKMNHYTSILYWVGSLTDGCNLKPNNYNMMNPVSLITYAWRMSLNTKNINMMKYVSFLTLILLNPFSTKFAFIYRFHWKHRKKSYSRHFPYRWENFFLSNKYSRLQTDFFRICLHPVEGYMNTSILVLTSCKSCRRHQKRT